MEDQNTLALEDAAAEDEGNGIEEKNSVPYKILLEAAGVGSFTARFFSRLFSTTTETKEFLRQCYLTGNRSLPLVMITGFIMGLVLTVQSRPTLAEFGAESWLPGMVAISIVREIGPVITALICAGKIGSGIGAELGSMRVTEQIDAMEVSGTDPFNFLVRTRVLAVTFMVPLLVLFSDAVALGGAYLGVNIYGHVDTHLFRTEIFRALHFSDLLPAFIKTFFFGMAIGLIGCYKGYHAGNGTESVGRAANSAVVFASLTVFVIDMLAVQLTNVFTL
ncbi:MAG TPA: ABC transporter permease [Bacteroidia bacterium]|jgi:phospholipid/cholesterol/gamma-HCH transport system permease protein